MKKKLNLFVSVASFLMVTVAFQNCSKVGFTPDAAALSSSSVGGNGNDSTCSVDTVSSTKTVKVLFLIDTSGSNQSNNGSAGTDEGKVWRLQTLNDFLNVYQAKSNFQFGFATFQGTAANPLISSGGHGVFTNDSSKINAAITAFKATADNGNTPYDAALNVVKDMVAYDQSLKASTDVAYVVVMISDGSPTNTSYTASGGMTVLSNDVKAILAKAPGQVSMNTVYLYNASIPSASSKSYLQTISSVGSGTFIEASSKSTLTISDTVSVSSQNCTSN